MNELYPSLPSLVAAVIYIVVSSLCFAAFWVRNRGNHSNAPSSFWLFASLCMAAYAVARLVALEDTARSGLRDLMTNAALIEVRGTYQTAIVAIVLIASGALVWKAIRPLLRRHRSSMETAMALGKASLAGIGALITVRLISLHATDTLLFTEFLGPIRLNWLLDIGLVSTLGVSAARTISLSRNMAQ